MTDNTFTQDRTNKLVLLAVIIGCFLVAILLHEEQGQMAIEVLKWDMGIGTLVVGALLRDISSGPKGSTSETSKGDQGSA